MEPLGRPHLPNTSSLCCGSHDSHPTSREVVRGRGGGEEAVGRGGGWRDPSWGEWEGLGGRPREASMSARNCHNYI